ncbi:MAG: hypothetical protein H6Q14_1086 [Bacteroidetes bacterium]|nr:hypothetical protein [Bacteroidota bacterium]
MIYLNEYEYLKKLGTGAYATVFKARHLELGYIRAIRELHGSIENQNDPIYKNFLEECKILLRLGNGGHPNIVHIYRPRLLQNRALVEMDFIDGCDMDDYLKANNGFVPIAEVIRFAKEISSALAYCHEDIFEFCLDRNKEYKYELESPFKGQTFTIQSDPEDGTKELLTSLQRKELIREYKVIHNDLHSKNIMCKKYDGSFILLDFGLAIQDGTVIKSSKRNGGAPEYKAPEKWDNDSIISEQSDIYSFGVLLYEMLAGRVPFVYDKSLSQWPAEYKLSEQHKNELPPEIETLRRTAFESSNPGKLYKKDFPSWLEQVIRKCLAKKPAERYANGKELNTEIKHFLSISSTVNKPDGGHQDRPAIIPVAAKQNATDSAQPTDVRKKAIQTPNIPSQNSARKQSSNVWKPTLLLVLLLSFLAGAIFIIRKSMNKRRQHTTVSAPRAEPIPEPIDTVSETDQEDVISSYTETVNEVSFDMAAVQGGTFQMGNKHGEINESPVHEVTLSSYYIGRTEVTQALWQAIMGTSLSEQRDKVKPDESLYGEGDEYPMYYVSWEDCQEFINKLNSLTGKSYRLPTEAEWEFATKEGSQDGDYNYSGSNVIGKVAWYDSNSEQTAHPVAGKTPNKLGIYDMSGNVREWCSDWYGDYSSDAETNPSGPSSGQDRVSRGGAWDFDAPYCQTTFRDKVPASDCNRSLGFRLAADI